MCTKGRALGVVAGFLAAAVLGSEAGAQTEADPVVRLEAEPPALVLRVGEEAAVKVVAVTRSGIRLDGLVRLVGPGARRCACAKERFGDLPLETIR